MARPLVLFALLLPLGCGGGSGAPTTTPLEPGVQLQQAVEDCLAPDLADLSALLERLEALAAGGDAALLDALYEITGIDVVTGQVGLALDLDVDGEADVQLVLGFLDSGGRWILPLDLLTLLGGTPTLDGILAAIPDGASLVVDSTLLGDATGGGTLAVEFAGGLPVRVSGEGSFARAGCGFDYALDFTPPSDPAIDPWPLLDIGVSFEAGGETATGTVTLDGTNLALLTAGLPGEPEQSFTLDLLTGAITPS